MNPLSYDPGAVYQLSRQRAVGAERAAETQRRVREVRAAAAEGRSSSPRSRRRWPLAVVRRLRLAS